MLNDTNAEKIRRINDGFRRSMVFGGTVLLTPGVSSLEPERLAELLRLVREFDQFTPGNDPHGEHDFGAVEFGNVRYFWKIEYYDLSKTVHSPDPANQAVTHRVLTVMRVDEY
ncbi:MULTISPECIES: DUF3768 domain-containing protein [unclassified Bradyrhizobium]|uniref:DUF3768 domain-containing protein n=1 Tax=unclassified Bradyrhizobium TaxID=2631580 RepID=UPI0028F0FD45|nr:MULTISPECIES: DUF3768 domain-containing protein [unclassified Bradyrhizobium]